MDNGVLGIRTVNRAVIWFEQLIRKNPQNKKHVCSVQFCCIVLECTQVVVKSTM